MIENLEPTEETASSSQGDDLWTRMMADVRARFPHVSPGIGFCILKLEQNAELRLRDFKAEAELHGIRLSGRSFHSARVALGLDVATVRQREPEAVATAVASPARPPANRPTARIEAANGEDSPAIAALRLFEAKNAGDVERLRAAIRDVIAVIDDALRD